MALRGQEGFDIYTTTGGVLLISSKYTASGAVTTSTTTRFGRGRCWASVSSGNTLTIPLGAAASATTFLAGAVGISASGGTIQPLMQFLAAGVAICSAYIQSDGSIEFVRGSTRGTNVLYRSAAGVTGVGFYHIGIALTRHASAGIVSVYLNGALLATTTALNTGASDIDAFTVGSGTSNFSWDDLYWKDDITSLGDLTCELLPVSADGTPLAWTPNSGTAHFSRLSEQPSDGDTSYVSSATVAQKDRFDVTNLSVTPSAIHAVKVLNVARKDDATVRQIRTNLISGATTTNGATKTVGTTYLAQEDIYQTDPNTGIAWTKTNVDAIQLELEVVT